MPSPKVIPQKQEIIQPTASGEEVKKKKFPFLKISLLIFFIILLLAAVGISVFFYLSSRKCQSDKEDCQNDLQLVQDETEDSEDEAEDNGSEDSGCPEIDCPDCVCPGGAEPCTITFTEEEKLMMEGWIEYSNPNYHYSFMHPPGWMIVSYSPESLEAGESLSFEFFVLSGAPLEETILPNPLFTVENGSVLKVDCIKAFQMRVNQPVPDPWEGVATYVINNGTPHVIWVRFKDVGASVTADTIELYNLVLKTFEFE